MEPRGWEEGTGGVAAAAAAASASMPEAVEGSNLIP